MSALEAILCVEMSDFIDFGKEIDIRLLEDQKHILEIIKDDLELTNLFKKYIERFKLFFPDIDMWRIINRQGGFHLKSGSSNKWVSLREALEFTSEISHLSQYEGFEKLIEQLNNPTQFNSKRYEVYAANLCISSKIHKNITFSPQVLVNGHIKNPEFLWETELGDIYCECKQSNTLGSNISDRLRRIVDIADNVFKEFVWHENARVRLEIDFGVQGDISKKIRLVLRELNSTVEYNNTDSSILENGIKAGFIALDDNIENLRLAEPGRLFQCQAIQRIGNKPTRILAEGTYLTVCIDSLKYITKITNNLVKDARRQLPKGHLQGMFIQTISPSLLVDKVIESIAPEFRNDLGFILLQDRRESRLIHRSDAGFTADIFLQDLK